MDSTYFYYFLADLELLAMGDVPSHDIWDFCVSLRRILALFPFSSGDSFIDLTLFKVIRLLSFDCFYFRKIFFCSDDFFRSDIFYKL